MDDARTLDEANRCIRDVVALSTLPALWLGAVPLRIAESLLAAVDSTIAPRFAYLCLRFSSDQEPVQLALLGREPQPMLAAEIGPAIRAWSELHDPEDC